MVDALISTGTQFVIRSLEALLLGTCVVISSKAGCLPHRTYVVVLHQWGHYWPINRAVWHWVFMGAF